MPTVDEVLFGAPPTTSTPTTTPTTSTPTTSSTVPPPAPTPTVDEVLFGAMPAPPADAPGARAGQVAGEMLRGPGPYQAGLEPEEPDTAVRPPYRLPDEPTPMSGLEQAGWTAAGVGVPTVFGMGAGLAGGPVAGMVTGGLTSAGLEHLRQQREQELHLRKDVSPGLIAFEGATGAFPGVSLEKLGVETLGKKVIGRGVEGAVMGGASATGRAGIGEGRLPTVDEVLFGAAVGGATGTALGGGGEVVQHGLGARSIGRAHQGIGEALDPAQWTPHPVGSEVLYRPYGGEEGRTERGRIVQHDVDEVTGKPEVWIDPGDGTHQRLRSMEDVELAPAPEGQATAPAVETPAANAPEPPRLVTEPGQELGGVPPFVGPPPPPDAGIPPPGGEALPPPDAEARLPGEPPDEWEQRRAAASPFRHVPGLGDAMGEEGPGARPRDPERLAGEIAAIPRLFGNLSKEGQQVIEYSVRENADAIAARAQQTIPMAETRQLARDLTYDPRKGAKQPKGTAYNATQLEAIGNHIDALGQQLERTRADFEADPTSQQTAARLKNAYDELTLTVLAYQGGKAETGRALNMMKSRKRALDMGDPRFITEANKAGIPAAQIAEILKKTDPLDKTARFEALVGARKPGFWKQLDSYLFQNLLSAPVTQVRNVVGNTINLIKAPLTTPVAGGMDYVRAATLGGERQIYAREAFSHAAGYKDAFLPAVKGFFQVMTKGYAPGAEEHFEVPPVEIGEGRSNRTRALLNPISRGMRGADVFFRSLVTQGESRALAYRDGRNQAFRELAAKQIAPDQFKARFAELVAHNVTHPTPEALEAARKVGERGVYQESGKVDQIMKHLQDIPLIGKRVLPFVRTPMAIIRQGFQMTPTGFLSKAGRQGGRAGAQAQAEAFIGSMGMLALYLAAEDGKITGSGPSDPNERERLYKTGWRPNAVLMNGHYVGYGITGPLAVPISVVANIRDRMKELEDAGDIDGLTQFQDVAWTTLQRMQHTILDQSYLKGINDLLEAVDAPSSAEDPIPKKVQRVGANLVTPFIPGSSLLRSLATTTDPELKGPANFSEELKARLPGLSQSVPPRIRSTGDPITLEKPGGWMGQMLLPTDISRKVEDPVGAEMHRLDVPFTTPDDTMVKWVQDGKDVKVRLAPLESLAMRQAKGFAQQAAIERLINQPGWNERNPENQAILLQQEKEFATGMVQQNAAFAKRDGQPITVESLYPPYLGAPKVGWAPR